AALERSAPLERQPGARVRADALDQIVARVDARADVGVPGVTCEIQAQPRHHPQAVERRKLGFDVPGGSKDDAVFLRLEQRPRSERPWIWLAGSRGARRAHQHVVRGDLEVEAGVQLDALGDVETQLLTPVEGRDVEVEL